LQRNAEIQQKQQEVSNRYVYDLIAEWAKRSGLPMLDLGGATGCPAGYKSVDLRDADIVCDIRYGLPMADNSVACIRAYDFLEHVPTCRDSTCDHGADGKSPKCAVGLMNEIYRVLAPGGWLVSRTPSTDGRGAFQDPTHVSFWNPNSFWYYTRAEQAKYVPGIRCRFQGTRIQTFPTEWHKSHNILYVSPISSRSRVSGNRVSARSNAPPALIRRSLIRLSLARHCFRICTIIRPCKPCTWKAAGADRRSIRSIELTTALVVPKSVVVDPTLNARRALISNVWLPAATATTWVADPAPVAR
jgi:SAM-dependent methyltransferase